MYFTGFVAIESVLNFLNSQPVIRIGKAGQGLAYIRGVETTALLAEADRVRKLASTLDRTPWAGDSAAESCFTPCKCASQDCFESQVTITSVKANVTNINETHC